MDNYRLPKSEVNKILADRLRRLHYRHVFEDLPKSKRVLAAEAVIAEWEERNEAAKDKARDAARAKIREIQNEALLGNLEKVVKLLNEIEQ